MPVSSPLGRRAVCPLLYIHVYTGVYGESRNKHLMCLCVCICVYVAETEWKAIPWSGFCLAELILLLSLRTPEILLRSGPRDLLEA